MGYVFSIQKRSFIPPGQIAPLFFFTSLSVSCLCLLVPTLCLSAYKSPVSWELGLSVSCADAGPFGVGLQKCAGVFSAGGKANAKVNATLPLWFGYFCFVRLDGLRCLCFPPRRVPDSLSIALKHDRATNRGKGSFPWIWSSVTWEMSSIQPSLLA